MLNELQQKTGIKLREFKWVGNFTKANYFHFAEFRGWNGEIYIKEEGILTYEEYYKRLLSSGMCLYVNGMIIAREGYSNHYNSLHKYQLKMIKQEESRNTSGYPVINLNEMPVFESAVKLYQMGILSLEQLTVRIKKYIQPEKQDSVLATITKLAA